ncbi:hypothetical protein V5799_004688 [Amblyomma americanum]|uniref:Uncharacterized protein n=1 Tax=Amblyomma americanum TaxID=6943 RepID=A0AAQ4D5D4_AMBAM
MEPTSPKCNCQRCEVCLRRRRLQQAAARGEAPAEQAAAGAAEQVEQEPEGEEALNGGALSCCKGSAVPRSTELSYASSSLPSSQVPRTDVSSLDVVSETPPEEVTPPEEEVHQEEEAPEEEPAPEEETDTTSGVVVSRTRRLRPVPSDPTISSGSMPEISPEDEPGPSGMSARQASQESIAERISDSDSSAVTESLEAYLPPPPPPAKSGTGTGKDTPPERSEATSASEGLELSSGAQQELMSAASLSESDMEVDTSQGTQAPDSPEDSSPLEEEIPSTEKYFTAPEEVQPDSSAAAPSSGSLSAEAPGVRLDKSESQSEDSASFEVPSPEPVSH